MLEEVVAQNTLAIRDLIAILKGGGAMPAAQPASTPPAVPAAETKAPKANKTTTAPKADDTAPKPATYEQVAQALTGVIQRQGRDTGIVILAKFGVKKATELKPEQYAALLAACEAQADPVES